MALTVLFLFLLPTLALFALVTAAGYLARRDPRPARVAPPISDDTVSFPRLFVTAAVPVR